jgi:hypothetical protein
VEWAWARSRWGKALFEANCGIAGGTDVEFIRYYARLALDLVMSPLHAAAWAGSRGRQPLNMVIEQFMLSACLDFHRSHPHSPFKGVNARYLFPSPQAAFDSRYAARLGFTHLLGDAKHHPRVAQRLEERVRAEDEPFYARCMELAAAG